MSQWVSQINLTKTADDALGSVKISSHPDSQFSWHDLVTDQQRETFHARFTPALQRAVLHFALKYLAVAPIRERELS